MAILVNKKTKVLIQGITGREGSRACSEMLLYGTNVVAGVTPGKGGRKVNGVPVYNTISEAVSKKGGIDISLVAVPAPFVKDAVMEAIEGGIKLINILTEHVPTYDSAYIYRFAQMRGAIIIGPASVGIISPGLSKIGSIGSSDISRVFKRGNVGVISKSGGMTAEISSLLTNEGIGQSTVVGIGGDQIIGSDFKDIVRLFNEDKQTKAIVIFGEVGGSYEEQLADYIKKERIKKPIVALIAGRFANKLPKDTVLAHAGAIVSSGKGSYTSKVNSLRSAGVHIAETLDELPKILKKVLK